jgi:tetratricopeptide (TPR) repeat protein
MMKRPLIFFLFLASLSEAGWTATVAKIIGWKGEVKIRRGVEENWQAAAAGMLLEHLDTILTFENGEAVLELSDGATFRLGGNTILDMSDLRKITERELFLHLMSRKISKIPPREDKTRLRIGNVSSVHGEQKAAVGNVVSDPSEEARRLQETNGAKALQAQHYYPNAILKFHHILNKYPDRNDCGEIHFYLGAAFEAINRPGQALDAYQTVIEQSQASPCEDEAAWQRLQAALEKKKSLQK